MENEMLDETVAEPRTIRPFPATLSASRVEALLGEYRRRLAEPRADKPAGWYLAAAIAELEALAQIAGAST
jgi:hypothetical protein